MFTAALFTTAKGSNLCSSTNKCIKNVVYTYNGILFKLKKGRKFRHILQHGKTLRTKC